MTAEGIDIIMLNTGTADLNLNAPDEVIRDIRYAPQKLRSLLSFQGIFPARKAIVQYYQTKDLWT